MELRNLIIAGLALLLFFSLTGCHHRNHITHDEHVQWDYDGDLSPEHWGELSEEYLTCLEGHLQSPIDLETYSASVHKAEVLRFNYHPSALDILNNGHTIELDVLENNTISLFDKAYSLIQIHFHAPAEHQIDGIIYPMEMHMVHKNEAGELAVIGVFVKEGQNNAVLEDFWAEIPEQAEEHAIINKKCDLVHLIPENHEVLNYTGSLTTPPCTEGVNWVIISTPVEMSKVQINQFRELYDHNNRPIQPLGKRKIDDYVF